MSVSIVIPNEEYKEGREIDATRSFILVDEIVQIVITKNGDSEVSDLTIMINDVVVYSTTHLVFKGDQCIVSPQIRYSSSLIKSSDNVFTAKVTYAPVESDRISAEKLVPYEPVSQGNILSGIHGITTDSRYELDKSILERGAPQRIESGADVIIRRTQTLQLPMLSLLNMRVRNVRLIDCAYLTCELETSSLLPEGYRLDIESVTAGDSVLVQPFSMLQHDMYSLVHPVTDQGPCRICVRYRLVSSTGKRTGNEIVRELVTDIGVKQQNKQLRFKPFEIVNNDITYKLVSASKNYKLGERFIVSVQVDNGSQYPVQLKAHFARNPKVVKQRVLQQSQPQMYGASNGSVDSFSERSLPSTPVGRPSAYLPYGQLRRKYNQVQSTSENKIGIIPTFNEKILPVVDPGCTIEVPLEVLSLDTGLQSLDGLKLTNMETLEVIEVGKVYSCVID